MGRLVLLGALLGATASAAQAKTRVVVLGIGASDEKLAPVAASMAEQVMTELQRVDGVEVIGTSDVAAALGVERQKQLLGCADSTPSCLVEFSAALGAPWLVSGTLARSGRTMRFDVKLLRARDGKVTFRDGVIIKDESAVFDAVSEVVRRMVPSVELSAGIVTASRPVAPWVVFGAGLGTAVAGGVVLALGSVQRTSTQNALAAPASTALTAIPTYEQARQSLTDANLKLTVGGVLVGVGAAAAVGGLVWRFAASEAPRSPVSWSVSFGPASVQVGGTF